MPLREAYAPPPKDFLHSADLALRLILRLRDEGELTVSSAAAALDSSNSATHRALQMLIYRGFAVRTDRRTCLPGPALSVSNLPPGAGARLTQLCAETMRAIASETRETCHLTVLSGASSHFIYGVEGTQIVRVGNRTGQIIPAEQNAGGLITLADLSGARLRSLSRSSPTRIIGCYAGGSTISAPRAFPSTRACTSARSPGWRSRCTTTSAIPWADYPSPRPAPASAPSGSVASRY